MSSTNSRSNIGAVRSIQMDRGARIRTFRQLNQGNTAIPAKDMPHNGDTNGEQYTQALDRLTSFKVRHKKRVWQDRRKAEWQEEDVQLKRASKELIKSIQALVEASTWEDAACPPVAPAWGGHGSAGIGRERNVVQDIPKDDKSSGEIGTECFSEPSRPETLPQRQSPAATNLMDFSAGAQELETARLFDMQADRSHVQELRALVTDFKLQGSSGSQEGYMADLLVQARAAHRQAGTFLADRASALEAAVETSRQTLAAALAPDRAERSSSTHAFVLSSVGLGECHDIALYEQGAGESEPDEASEALGGCQNQQNAGGFREAMMRAEVSSRLGALEVEHFSRLSAARSEFLQDAAGESSAGSIEAALDANGGWPADQHFRFMKVIKAAKGAATGVAGGVLGGASRSSAAVMKRLSSDLPGVSPAEISRHESWYRQRSLLLSKKRAEKQRYERELEDLVTWGKISVEKMRDEEKYSVARGKQLEEHERRRAELDHLLRQQGEARERRNQENREREEKALQEKISKETEEAERKAVEDKLKRDAVAEYHASLQELRARETDAREAAARAAEAERAQRVPINKERVGFRQERARQKQEEHERREQEAKALEEKRLQVLEKLAASVPYAEACANAEAKLEHITAATAAHFDQFLPFDRSRGHCPMFGYNTGKVFKDARFRLGLYLREAGVSASKSAHAAVMRAAGPVAAAPYGQTA